MFPPRTLVQDLPPLSPHLPPLTLTVTPSLAWAVVLGIWGLVKMSCKALSKDVQTLAGAPQPDRFKFNHLGSRARKLTAAGNCTQLLSFPHIFLA